MRSHSSPSNELISRARSGEAAAREELLARCQSRILDRIRFMLGEEVRAHAESVDLVQSVMVAALEQPDESVFADEARLLRWMTTVARNGIRDRARRARVQAVEALGESTHSIVNPESSQPGPLTACAAGEREVLLAELVEQLAPEERQVLELRELEGQTFGQIAAALGGTDDRIRLAHQRAVLKLGRLCARRGI